MKSLTASALIAFSLINSANAQDFPSEPNSIDEDIRNAMEICGVGISSFRSQDRGNGFSVSIVQDLETYKIYVECLDELFNLSAEQLEYACTAGWRFQTSGELSVEIDDVTGKKIIKGPVSQSMITRVDDLAKSDSAKIYEEYTSCLSR